MISMGQDGAAVRTKEGDNCIELPVIVDHKLLDTLNELTQINYICKTGPEHTETIQSSESKMVPTKIKCPLIYFREGQYSLHQALLNGTLLSCLLLTLYSEEPDYSTPYREFINTIGTVEKNRVSEPSNSSEECFVKARYQDMEFQFVPSSTIPSGKRTRLFKKGVVIIFSEASSFDPALLRATEISMRDPILVKFISRHHANCDPQNEQWESELFHHCLFS